MDAVERIITHAVRSSKDGRIDVSDFLNEAASSMRYGMFTPMEVSLGRILADFRQISFGISQVEAVWDPTYDSRSATSKLYSMQRCVHARQR
jgi:hypothetical protein